MIIGFHNPNEENGYLSNWYLSDFVIDGDEYCTFESLIEVGLINQENIVRRKKLYD